MADRLAPGTNRSQQAHRASSQTNRNGNGSFERQAGPFSSQHEKEQKISPKTGQTNSTGEGLQRAETSSSAALKETVGSGIQQTNFKGASVGQDSNFTEFKMGSIIGKSPTPERMSPFNRASPQIPSSVKSSITVKSIVSQAREEADIVLRPSVGKPPRSSKKQTPSSKMVLPAIGSESPQAVDEPVPFILASDSIPHDEPILDAEPVQEVEAKPWTPMISKDEKLKALDYGHSFGSKKVEMGPGFINLRFMCHCLGRAVMKHMEFSKGEYWFLQDLQTQQQIENLEFSYRLPDGVKMDHQGMSLQQYQQSPLSINALPPLSAGNISMSPAESVKSNEDIGKQFLQIESKLQEKVDYNKRVIDQVKPKPFQSQPQTHNVPQSLKMASEEIMEEFDRDEDYSDFEDQPDREEEQSIEKLRKAEMQKSIVEKDKQHIQNYMNEKNRVTELEMKLKSKDQQIKALSKIVREKKTGGLPGGVPGALNTQQVFAISHDPNEEDEESEEGDSWAGPKMTRAEWLMAQVDLDPIESHGSMEMSTCKFQSLAGSKRKNMLLMASGGQSGRQNTEETKTNNLLERKDSSRGSNSKKTAAPSYESTRVNVEDNKMRTFVMDQLKRFDCRMQYDGEIFEEDRFVGMPSEAQIVDYCKYVTIACKMENEIPIVSLVYLEKLLLMTGILLNKYNWRRMVLICLCLASKIWDDDSLENVHFPKVMPDVTNLEINKLEQIFLEFIDYKLVIKGSEYARYYFILRTLSQDIIRENGQKLDPFEAEKRNKRAKDEWAEFPLMAPIKAEKMLSLQKSEAKAEIFLKEKHDRDFVECLVASKQAEVRKGEDDRKDTIYKPILDRTL